MDFLTDEEAAWLEESLRKIYESDPKAVCVAAVLDTGDVLTGYSNCEASDKLNIASAIQMDGVMDVIRANGRIIREALEEEEDCNR